MLAIASQTAEPNLQSPKLNARYFYETQYWKLGFTNGVRKFCRCLNILIKNIILHG